MLSVSARREWVDKGRRIADAPRAPVVAGVLLGVLAVTESLGRAAVNGVTARFAVVLCLLALATTLPLALLRPAGAAIAVSAASAVSLALFHAFTAPGLAVQLIVLYRLGPAGPRLWVLGLAMPFPVLALAGPDPTTTEAAALTVLLASLAPAATWAGIAWHARREADAQIAARQAIVGTLMEHSARGERVRIAHELHDVVAHHISMVAVQAETARLTTPGMPAAGAQRLSAIGDTARAALTEMRRLLGVLREDSHPEGADRRPQPGLGQLNDLLDEARDASGTATRLILRGSPVTLDPGVELAAYRIAQEALTNARRHAPGAAVDVEVHYTEDALLLRIRDNGPGPAAAAPVGGHGLSGMRERAWAVAGEMRSGPAPGGGFLVEATLPTKAEVPA
jgi:signal transduction histidine kinase